MNMLIVDDDPLALKILTRQLASIGYQSVTACERVSDAKAMLDDGLPTVDLVFCDLQMPDVDGVEFVRHLAHIGFDGALVVVSGEDGRILHTAERLAQAHQIPVLGAFPKPVTVQQLRDVMVRFGTLRGSRALRERHPFSLKEFRRAIDERELINHYQPKVALGTGLLHGVEALVRWQHPRVGLVYPDQFVALAEEGKLIDALTERVLENALDQVRRWQDHGLAMHMAVNVSMDSLAALDFPDMVAQRVQRAGVGHSVLTLEVTESRLMKDMRSQLDTLARLRLKRIGLSIDDFGTGHSSLTQLRDVPFDELKLDSSFVTGCATDSDLTAIVSTTIAMARQLGLRTVAEGIETRSDWDFLRGLGCDLGQGYFVARPMPGDALVEWARGWEARRPDLTIPP